MYNNVDQKGSAVDVALEVNQRNPLHTGEEACMLGTHHGFESHSSHPQKSKPGV